jgi:phosphoribosylcarboxyaminoimidazole (NCAIR) mutase
MQTDTDSLWSTVVFVPSGGAMAILEAQQAKNAAAVADGDEPPPLE